MFRLLAALTVLLVLGGCATTTRYHQAGEGGDYYYGDSTDAYYGDAPYADCRYVDDYDAFGQPVCRPAGWVDVGPYWDAYPGWGGWGYPYYDYYGYYADPYFGYWSTGLWFGAGAFGPWGYPGYYNPGFDPWWPYAVVYPVHQHRRGDRDLRRLHREQALQASWRRQGYGRSTVVGGAGVRREGAAIRQRETLRRYPVEDRRARLRGTPRSRPAQEGIPVNWRVGGRARQPERMMPAPRLAPDPPVGVPRGRPDAIDASPSRSDSMRTMPRSVPLPRSAPLGQSVPRQPMPVSHSLPAARPVLRSVPSSMPVRSQPAAPAAGWSSSGGMHESRSGPAPRGRPARDDGD